MLVTATAGVLPTDPAPVELAVFGVTAPAVPLTVALTDNVASASWTVVPRDEDEKGDSEKVVRPKLIFQLPAKLSIPRQSITF